MPTTPPSAVHDEPATYRSALTPKARAAIVRDARGRFPVRAIDHLRREDTATGSGHVRFAGLEPPPTRQRRR